MSKLPYIVRLIDNIAKIDVQRIRKYRQLEAMEIIAHALERVSDKKLSGVISLDSLVSVSCDLKKFKKEYKLFNLAAWPAHSRARCLLGCLKGGSRCRICCTGINQWRC